MKKAVAILLILLYSTVAFSRSADCNGCNTESGRALYGFGNATGNGNDCGVKMIACKTDSPVLYAVNVQRDFSTDIFFLISFVQSYEAGQTADHLGPLFAGTWPQRKSSRQLLSFIHILQI